MFQKPFRFATFSRDSLQSERQNVAMFTVSENDRDDYTL